MIAREHTRSYVKYMTNTKTATGSNPKAKIYQCTECSYSCAYQSGDRKHGRAWAAMHTCTAGASLVGCGVYHRGEHGMIEAFDATSYDVPMYRVRFGTRIATLRLVEMGAVS